MENRKRKRCKKQWVLSSVESFEIDEEGLTPSYTALMSTMGVVILSLYFVEQGLRQFLISIQVRYSTYSIYALATSPYSHSFNSSPLPDWLTKTKTKTRMPIPCYKATTIETLQLVTSVWMRFRVSSWPSSGGRPGTWYTRNFRPRFLTTGSISTIPKPLESCCILPPFKSRISLTVWNGTRDPNFWCFFLGWIGPPSDLSLLRHILYGDIRILDRCVVLAGKLWRRPRRQRIGRCISSCQSNIGRLFCGVVYFCSGICLVDSYLPLFFGCVDGPKPQKRFRLPASKDLHSMEQCVARFGNPFANRVVVRSFKGLPTRNGQAWNAVDLPIGCGRFMKVWLGRS